ncbi:MAG: hypothetical protein PHT69_15545 [Bacteroidales bacterium]|nr:hypothetical protein [Bacteroidales bacterium]
MYNIFKTFKFKLLKTIAFLLGTGFLIISGCRSGSTLKEGTDENTVEIIDSLPVQEIGVTENNTGTDTTQTAIDQPVRPSRKSKPKENEPINKQDTVIPSVTRPLEPAAAYGTFPAEFKTVIPTNDGNNE